MELNEFYLRQGNPFNDPRNMFMDARDLQYYNLEFAKQHGLETAILWHRLLDMTTTEYREAGVTLGKTFFEAPLQLLCDTTALTPYLIRKGFKKLEELDYIVTKIDGVPARKFVLIRAFKEGEPQQ